MRTTLSAMLALYLTATTPSALASFLDNGNGTITDSGTKLMWQQCSAPASGTGCTSGAPAMYAWSNALAYCEALALAGFTDWRLPNVRELQSLVDVAKPTSPTINVTYFPDTQASDYWSSTTFVDTPSYAWYVQFSIGIAMTSPVSKTNTLYTRCVRGG